MSADFQVTGTSAAAPFTLKIHRGDGMALLAMNWREGKPPRDFVGFAIEYREPGGTQFFALKNRLTFPGVDGKVDPEKKSTKASPIQMFRWVHFPRNANLDGDFLYRVTPMFMNADGTLREGEPQEAALELRRETYPGQLNVAFTRGFVMSQAFVDKFIKDDRPLTTLLPRTVKDGLTFQCTHPDRDEALAWMGFEARAAILGVLDEAVADATAQVRVVAFDLNEPVLLGRLEALGPRLKVIVDDSEDHEKEGAAENTAVERLIASAGEENVKRQHMGSLQHNKTIVVDGKDTKVAVCGSTNFSWNGFFVQNNNAVVMRGEAPVKLLLEAFEAYWNHGKAAPFGGTPCATFRSLGLDGIDAEVAFSPHTDDNALLARIADDIRQSGSSVFYSLAFLHQTDGPIVHALDEVTNDPARFVTGIADQKVGGIVVAKPGGNRVPVHPEELSKNVPEPFKSEPKRGRGPQLHHKFVVIDFDQPTARVYLGSYNFSDAADTKNGENLLRIRDRRIAVSYMIEALRIIDHYQFRLAQLDAETAKKQLTLARPPKDGETPWWDEFWSNPVKQRDRELFA